MFHQFKHKCINLLPFLFQLQLQPVTIVLGNAFLDLHSHQTPENQIKTNHNYKYLYVHGKKERQKNVFTIHKEEMPTLHLVGCTPTVQNSLAATNIASSNTKPLQLSNEKKKNPIQISNTTKLVKICCKIKHTH